MKPCNHETMKLGQTLIETIIAIGVMAVGLVAILSLAISYISFAGQTKERVIATGLAREGVEVIRGIRDNNRLRPYSPSEPRSVWPYGLTNGDWVVNYNETTLDSSGEDTNITLCDNCWLCYDSGTNKYTRCQTASAFKRLVKVEAGDNDWEKKVTVFVWWQEHGRDHIISLEDRITDWR